MLDVDRCWVKSSKPRVSVADRGPCLQRSSCSQSVHERGRTCPSVGPRAVTLRVPGDPRPTKKEKETERDEVERLRRSAELRLGEPKTEIHVRKGRIGIAYGHEKRGDKPETTGSLQGAVPRRNALAQALLAPWTTKLPDITRIHADYDGRGRMVAPESAKAGTSPLSEASRARRGSPIGIGSDHNDRTEIVEGPFVGDHSSNGGWIGECGNLRFIGPWHGGLGLPHRALRMNPRTRVDSLMADRATEPRRDRGVKMLGIHRSSSRRKPLPTAVPTLRVHGGDL